MDTDGAVPVLPSGVQPRCTYFHTFHLTAISPASVRGSVRQLSRSITLKNVSPNPLINNVSGECNSQMTISNSSCR